MQKARSLDRSLSILERYVEEVNSRYGNIFQEFDKEIAGKTLTLEKIKLDMKSLHDSQQLMVSGSVVHSDCFVLDQTPEWYFS
ncbi:unnamed protein product [Linum tenue]|nr:unnamed protein product [Linum tenue]